MPPRFGYADTPLGQLHYVEQGEGPVVLLLHQTPRSVDEFRELLPLLATRNRVVAMDMPGFGQSVKLPVPQRIEDYAAGASALLDALRVPRATVLGHHTGGAVAIELAARSPARVAALVLSSTPWTGPEYRAKHADGPAVDVAEQSRDGAHLGQLWAGRAPYYPEPAAPLLDRFIRDALAPGVDPAEGHRACGRYRMERRIGLVRAPVLLLTGDGDPFALPAMAELASRLDPATEPRQVVVPGGCVPLMEQKPTEVAEAVVRFLSELSARMPV